MSDYRTEHDMLGAFPVPAGALYGIHTARAMENFPLAGRCVRPALIHAYGAVKLACARTNHTLGWWTDEKAAAIDRACSEMSEGLLDEHIRVDAYQGGAGTSTNMNVNEVLANRALQLLDKPLGQYETVSPTEDINLHQSTNDTYPTALKVAGIGLLGELEQEIAALQEAFQEKEKAFAQIVKIGRTEYQDAVLTTLGKEMSAYAEAMGRDRWRVYKCTERLRIINLGGTAIGTGLGAPRQFIFRAADVLRDITGMSLARAENLVDATQNTDVFVEVSGIVKAHAASLLKIATDLRLISSGPEAGLGEIDLPARQPGSSIMPGKVNPVIPEAVTQAAMVAIANDQAITHAVTMGSLELNAFLPLIADKLLETLHLLRSTCRIFRTFCIQGIQPNVERCEKHVNDSTAIVTALVEEIGYKRAGQLAAEAADDHRSVSQLAVDKGLITHDELDELTRPERVTQLGSRRKRPDG
ncbi:MAG: aspartate ammonia-lyase [Phycisphaerae bacterium]